MKRLLLLYFACSLFICNLFCQGFDSRNGYRLPSSGTIRALVVFAEPDSTCLRYFQPQFISDNWKPGQMPNNAESLFDRAVHDTLFGSVSAYYHESSLGRLHIIGDYYPKLLQIPADSLGSFQTDMHAVMSALNSLEGDDIITKYEFSLNNHDFDLFTANGSNYGRPVNYESDNKIDLLILIWRCHPTIGINSGFGTYLNNSVVKTMNGFNSGVFLVSPTLGTGIITHEVSHMLLGPNSFHSGGGVGGTSKVLNFHAGHGLLSASGANLDGPNAWDRYRMGWLKSVNNPEISDANHRNSDVVLDNLTADTVSFLLRDFIKYGDAMRVRIPYTGSSDNCPKCEEQWMWIENYQMLPGQTATSSCAPTGLRVNIQIGNNDLRSDQSSINYYYPLINRGQYDFTVSSIHGRFCHISAQSSDENPFTGNAMSEYPAIYTANTKRFGLQNHSVPSLVIINGDTLGADSCCYMQYPNFGSAYDSFHSGDSITSSTNPASVNQTTCYTSSQRPSRSLSKYNNRYTHLSGLGLYFMDEIDLPNTEGKAIRVLIRKNDFDIANHKRWCGNILLHDSLRLMPKSSILLDWGTTPVRADKPVQKGDSIVFSDPTIFECLPNSVFEMKEKSNLILQAGSVVIVDSLATLIVGEKASIELRDSSRILVKAGGTLIVKSKSTIVLADEKALFSLQHGSIIHSASNSIIIWKDGSKQRKEKLQKIQDSTSDFGANFWNE